MSERMAEEQFRRIKQNHATLHFGLNSLEVQDMVREVERARANEATLTAQLGARDEALRVAREALRLGGFPCCGSSETSPPEHTQDCCTALAAIEEATK